MNGQNLGRDYLLLSKDHYEKIKFTASSATSARENTCEKNESILITPTYNSSKTLLKTLESVARQTYKDIEHIIIDGKSSDTIIDIIKSFPHIHKYISEPDNGMYDAMNKGIKLSSFREIIGILNSDDYYTKW